MRVGLTLNGEAVEHDARPDGGHVRGIGDVKLRTPAGRGAAAQNGRQEPVPSRRTVRHDIPGEDGHGKGRPLSD